MGDKGRHGILESIMTSSSTIASAMVEEEDDAYAELPGMTTQRLAEIDVILLGIAEELG